MFENQSELSRAKVGAEEKGSDHSSRLKHMKLPFCSSISDS